MSPRRPTTRRDSFGLEIREDGTIGFNMSPDEGIASDSPNLQRGTSERRECENDSPRSTGSDSWKNIVSLTRPKRRRDSFGLEVREDGTLSFDQLATANGELELKTSGNMKRKTSLVCMGDNGLRRTNTRPGRNRRRRDSFGLEIREDGTLSFDQLAGARPATTQSSGDNSMPNDDRRRDVHRSSTGGQVSDTPVVVQRNRIHPTHNHSRNQNHTSNSNSATSRHASSPPSEHQPRTSNRAGQGRVNNVEVEVLRERVRVLEAALAHRGPHANNATEQLPAYQSRPCSPTAERRLGRSVTEESD